MRVLILTLLWVGAETLMAAKSVPTQDETSQVPDTLAPLLPPPLGLLPVTEMHRLVYAPRDRPQAYMTSNQVLVTTTAGTLDAYNSTSGTLTWRLGLPGEKLFRPTQFYNDSSSLLVAAQNGYVRKVDVATGNILKEWKFDFQIVVMPIVAEGNLYLGTDTNEIIAVKFSDGHQIFKVAVSNRPTALSLHKELLIVASDKNSLLALDSTDGKEVWTFHGRGSFLAPAAFNKDGDRLFVGDNKGDFYSINTSNGKIRFRWRTGAAIHSKANVEGRIVYLTTYGNTLFAFNSGNGHELWRVDLPGRPVSSPLRINERLIVLTHDGILIEIDSLLGKESSRLQLPAEVFTEPSLFVPTPELNIQPQLARAAYSQIDTSLLTLQLGANEIEIVSPPMEQSNHTLEKKLHAASDLDMNLDINTFAGSTPDVTLLWFDLARLAICLRTGEVLVFKHDRPLPLEGIDSLSEIPEDSINKSINQKGNDASN